MGVVAGDGDVAGAAASTLVAVAAAADACAGGAAGSVHGAAGDGDAVGGSGITAADACAAILAGGSDLGVIAGNGDVVGTTVITAADTGTTEVIRAVSLTAGGVHCAAGDGDVVALAECTAADAGTAVHAALSGVAAGSGSDVAAGDGDIAAALIICTADACAARAAGGGQGAVGILCVDGQGAVLGRLAAVGVTLFQTRMSGTADEGVVSAQLDLGVAGTRHGQGGIAGLAGVDVHVVQRDRCGNALIGVDGRRVGRLGAIAGQGDRRFVVIVIQLDITVLHKVAVRSLLGDISALAIGVHGHAALGQVVGVRKSRRGAGRHHCQKCGGGKHPQGKLI